MSSAPSVPPFTLVNQDGTPVTEAALDGHVTVLTFFYASCDSICPRLHTQLRAVRAQLRDTTGVRFISVSLTPERDTPAELKMFAQHQSLPAGWTLLTGATDVVARVMGAPLFAQLRTVNRSINRTDRAHGETAFLLDAHRRVRGLYHGTQAADAAQLAADVATLQSEHGDR